MALVDEIVLKIKSNTVQFRDGIKKAEGATKKLGTVANKVFSGIKKAAKVAGVAVAGFSVGITKSMKSVDELAKTSAKLGLTAEQLQRLQYQANLSGVGTEKLNMAMQRMVRRVSEAASGTGEAKDALKELGLNAQQLAKLNPEQQFYKIAEAMKKVKNQQDKVRLAFKLFDSEGVALVNTLNSDLKKTRKEFADLGVALSGKEAKNVEKFNDGITKVKTIFTGIFNKIAAGLAGPLTQLTNKFIEFLKEGGAEKIKNTVVKGLNLIIQAYNSIVDGIEIARNALTDFIEIGVTKFKEISKVIVGVWVQARANLASFIDEGVAGFDRMINAVKRFGNMIVEVYKGMRMKLADFFESASESRAKFGKSRGFDTANNFIASDILKPTPLPKNIQQQRNEGQATIKVEVSSDADAIIKKLTVEREGADWIRTIFANETAQLGT